MRGKEQESCFSVVVTAVEFAESLIKDSFPKAHAGSSSLLEAAAGVPDFNCRHPPRLGLEFSL